MGIQTPSWVKHAVFYQIFPDRFAQGTPPANADQPWATVQPIPYEPWVAEPTLQGYKGGNLWGVIEKLDYLQDLGINALYFTPIFQSASNHRYHTHDYYQVDPILGGNTAFHALLQASHQRGMKVVLDGVFNHASRGFYFFNDILENGPYSPWVDWFKIEAWPLSAYDGSLPANYRGWVGNRALPEFNHDHPAVREYIMQIGEHWIRQGIDGWRLDVPFEVKAAGFWQEFRDRIKALNSEAYIVGEVWTDSRHWLDGTQFDGVMNYLFTGPTIAFTAGDRVIREHVEAPAYEPYPALDAPAYAAKMQDLLELYDWEIQLTQLNSLASHDTARLMTIAGCDRPSIELATLLQFTFPGAPCIYYGDEVGLPGGFDPDSRRSFPDPADWDQGLLDCHRALIALRHQYEALRVGTYRSLYSHDLLYVFERSLPEQQVWVAVNASDGVQSLPLSKLGSPALSQVVYGSGTLEADTLTLPPRSGIVLT
ncbi:MAG TPA: glycoside hydrolase family 13 protein [Candidatus Obscuribacterales bacterium]